MTLLYLLTNRSPCTSQSQEWKSGRIGDCRVEPLVLYLGDIEVQGGQVTHLRWASKVAVEQGQEPDLESILPHPALPSHTPRLSFLV